jgi:hypothetical protein
LSSRGGRGRAFCRLIPPGILNEVGQAHITTITPVNFVKLLEQNLHQLVVVSSPARLSAPTSFSIHLIDVQTMAEKTWLRARILNFRDVLHSAVVIQDMMSSRRRREEIKSGTWNMSVKVTLMKKALHRPRFASVMSRRV